MTLILKVNIMQNIGTPITSKYLFRLQPVKYYKGVAWYRKEVNIPTDWNLQDISLFSGTMPLGNTFMGR